LEVTENLTNQYKLLPLFRITATVPSSLNSACESSTLGNESYLIDPILSIYKFK
jgi:hypothetical protein